MTPSAFRKEALAVPGAIENAHMNHPDFRVYGKIFASLGYPDELYAMVKLTPEQQREFIGIAPKVFSPSFGAWGKQGSTRVLLTSANKSVISKALAVAANNIRAKYPRPRDFNP